MHRLILDLHGSEDLPAWYLRSRAHGCALGVYPHPYPHMVALSLCTLGKAPAVPGCGEGGRSPRRFLLCNANANEVGSAAGRLAASARPRVGYAPTGTLDGRARASHARGGGLSQRAMRLQLPPRALQRLAGLVPPDACSAPCRPLCSRTTDRVAAAGARRGKS